jgi:hypothetical protein
LSRPPALIFDEGGESSGAPTQVVMTTTREVPAAVEELVSALTQSYGQIHLILAHMAENASDDADAPPFDVVLHGVLGDVLTRLPDEHGIEDVATAAQMVQAANDVIAEDIYLVDADKLGPMQ